ncbi:hypothetical protein V3C99_007117 [Haemonchus contortus]
MGPAIKVIGDEFMSDPCTLAHECSPAKYVEERGTRAVYEELQKIREDPSYAGKQPVKVFIDLIAKNRDTENEEIADGIRAAIRKAGYRSRRRGIQKNINLWQNRSVTMENVPEEFRVLHDGSLFLQVQEAGFHVYYSAKTIQMACENGLHTIVADGVHSLHPKCLGRYAQLYSLHGVCSHGVEVPLVFCITEKKTREVYKRIFEQLKRNVEGEGPQRIVLDFEKAAIQAAKLVFPSATIEGCAFHLAQAWNRKRDSLALRKHIQGHSRDDRIVKWWQTIKGIVFLPAELLSEVRALQRPPVPQDHVAYDKCLEFLDYLKSNWMSGPFKDLWCKWKLKELRTTNLAEAFHRRLQVLAGVDHPPLSTLIDVMRGLNYEAKAALIRLKENPEGARTLQRNYQQRKEKIYEEMERFDELQQQGVSRQEIREFCIKMSRYVTNKTI